jgi:class 3 adenylate cyclase
VWRGIALAAGLAVAWVGVAIAAFTFANVWLPVTLPVLVLLPVMLLLAELMRYLAAKHSIDTYLPRGLARRVLLGQPSDATVEVTVMFTDIVGFTTLAERLQAISPTAVQAFQNRHLRLLAPAIHAHGGEILDFTGDGVMAAWGWPDLAADHAAQACRAALAISAAVERDNVRGTVAGEPPVHIRVGIHSGIASGGDIGGAEQRCFTLSGDVVNVTSRVEQLGRELCPDRPTAAILVSAATVERCGGGFAFEPLGEFVLRGRARPEPIYRLRQSVVERRRTATAATAAAAIAAVVAVTPAVAQGPARAPQHRWRGS